MGEVLDSLGFGAPQLGDGDLVAGAVVLLQVIEADGTEVVHHARSSGTSWLTQRAMVELHRDELSSTCECDR